MQKKFLAVSLVALWFSVQASSSRADSIHSPDLVLDSSGVFSNSRALDSFGSSNLFDDFGFRSLNRLETAALSGGLLSAGGKDLSTIPVGAFGLPSSSHLVRRFEASGSGLSSADPGPSSVPEPNSAYLGCLGMLALALFGKSRSRKPPLPPGNF
jgi:hypothetical protein